MVKYYSFISKHSLYFSLNIILFLPWIPSLLFASSSHYLEIIPFQLDQMHYLARTVSVWQGKNISSTFLSNPSSKIDGLGSLIDYIFFSINKVPILNNVNYRVWIYLVIVFAIFMCTYAIYSFSFFMIKDWRKSALLAACFICIPDFINTKISDFSQPWLIDRWPVPALHYSLIFLYLRYLLDTNNRHRTIFMTLIFSGSFYTYFYTWQAITAITLGYCVYSLLKNRNELRKIFSILTMVTILAIPYFWLLFNELLMGDDSKSFAFIIGLEHSRLPTINKTTAIIALILIFVLRKIEDPTFIILVFIIFIAIVVVNNQQLITGLELQPGHFHWYFAQPFLFYFIIYVFLKWEENRTNSKSYLMNFLFFTILSISAYMSIQMMFVQAKQIDRSSIFSQNSEVNSNLESNVFIPDLNIANQFVLNSNMQIYWHPFANFYPISRQRMIDSILINGIWKNSQNTNEDLIGNCKNLDPIEPCWTFLVLAASDVGLSKENWNKLGNSKILEDSKLKLRNEVFKEVSKIGIPETFQNLLNENEINSIIISGEIDRSQEFLISSGWKIAKFEKNVADGRAILVTIATRY